MTPAEEATFIALWSQGFSQDAIAQQLGCPVGTVKSRAHTLAHQGKIQARPRGGAYPRLLVKARPEDAGVSTDTPRVSTPPVQTPVQITALPPYPQGKAVRWNLWILDAIKDQISALAAERNLLPSELVQEYLWKALIDQSPSMP